MMKHVKRNISNSKEINEFIKKKHIMLKVYIYVQCVMDR